MLEPPHPEWLIDLGVGVAGDALSRMATSVYNATVEAGLLAPDFFPVSGFNDVLWDGGDAELWTIIRLGPDETTEEDVVSLCEQRGFRVLKAYAEHEKPRSRRRE